MTHNEMTAIIVISDKKENKCAITTISNIKKLRRKKKKVTSCPEVRGNAWKIVPEVWETHVKFCV